MKIADNSLLRELMKPLWVILLFVLLQTGVSVLVLWLFALMEGSEQGVMEVLNSVPSPQSMVVSIFVSDALLVLCCWKWLKMIRLRRTLDFRAVRWKMGFVGFIATALGIISMNLLNEQFSLPDIVMDNLISMMDSVWGILAIAVVGPVVEELVFREAILGHYLRMGMKPWWAIFFSALIFGVIHFNPAQVPVAMGIGMILGMIYYKTGNIVLCSLIHIYNNSFSVAQVLYLDEEATTFRLTDWLGGTYQAWAVILLTAFGCGLLLRKFWLHYESKY